MTGQPTPWRASLADDGTWRVLRSTFMGWFTRVEVCLEGLHQDEAYRFAQRENTK